MNLDLKASFDHACYHNLVLSLENRISALKRERNTHPPQSRQYLDLAMRKAGVEEALARVKQAIRK